MKAEVYLGDCLEILKKFPNKSVDLVYLDPPFFTQKIQKLGTRDRTKKFLFPDTWKSIDTYSSFLYSRLQKLHDILRPSGSVFFHCDRNASHIARLLLDEIFGKQMFRAEIIWHYRRWSNSQKNLLPAHQNILFYSKTNTYKFNEIIQDYSPSTNIDQILQKRIRDKFGKAVYARDEQGNIISNGYKKGVPLSDVWDIPFLNPKAKERTGYPTQKPILLIEKIIQLTTDKGDLVLDPFCGSGTTLVAAKLLERNSIGIDISPDAVQITNNRLSNSIKTKSYLLEAGRESYKRASEYALSHLKGLDIVPVQRNRGIDALLKVEYKGCPIPIRVQRSGESLLESAYLLFKASKNKGAAVMILVATAEEFKLYIEPSIPPGVIIVDSASKTIKKIVEQLKKDVKAIDGPLPGIISDRR